MASSCKDCGAPLDWEQAGGRWIPNDPTTGQRHRCEIDVRCESCQEIFQGAPWMKQCPKCYRAGGNTGGRASNSPPAAPSPSRPKEPLQDDMRFDDDKPPF